MPLYTVMTQAGALGDEAGAALSAELTALHSHYAGVPGDGAAHARGSRPVAPPPDRRPAVRRLSLPRKHPGMLRSFTLPDG